MGDIKNLRNKEGIEKLQSIAKDIKTCLFGTYDNMDRLQTAPMAVNKVDDDGVFYFLSTTESTRNYDLKNNSETELLFADISASTYASVHGISEVLYDKELIKELWNPIVKAWFTEGVDDPRASVIKFTPDDAYYWDTKHGKMISFMKIIAGAVTGKTMDDGIEGKISV